MLKGLTVVDDEDGIFFPSRWGLSDGSVLLSYRLGHCGLLQPGDVIAGPELPLVRIGGRRHWLIAGYEHFAIETPSSVQKRRSVL